MSKFESIIKKVRIPENLESPVEVMNFVTQLVTVAEKLYSEGNQRKEIILELLQHLIANSTRIEDKKKLEMLNFIKLEVPVYIEQLVALSKTVNKGWSFCCL